MDYGLGAHGSLGPTPSFFEVSASAALGAGLQPAFKHLLLVLAQRWPNQLGWALRNQHEAFLAVSALLQRHYLRKYGASFAENFYGMKRGPLVPQPTVSWVGRTQREVA
jgi:peroxin-12